MVAKPQKKLQFLQEEPGNDSAQRTIMTGSIVASSKRALIWDSGDPILICGSLI